MIRSKRSVAGLLVMLVAVAAGSHSASLAATAPQQQTAAKPIAIYVQDMHCAGCAKKISSKLYTVKGVTKVNTDLKKHVAYVVASPKQDPSLKALWEAIEAVEFKPIKLVTATQTFTSKPKK